MEPVPSRSPSRNLKIGEKVKTGNDIVTGSFLYKPGMTYTQGDIVSHNGVMYVVMAEETTAEPSFGDEVYQEYAYNKAVKDTDTVMDEQSKFRIVAGSVVEKILSDALGSIRTDQLSGKINKMQALSAYESLSYTLDGKVTTLSGTSFSFKPSEIADVDVTELDVFVTFAPSDIPQSSGNLIYMQEMVRCVLTDKRQVYAGDSEYMSVSVALSTDGNDDVYTVSITPDSMKVVSQTMEITRIEGVGTIVSEPAS